MTRTCLDLFAGLGGFSAAFEDADGWDVITADNNPDLDPDICADILDLGPDDLPRADIVMAGPPCPALSHGGGHTDIDEHGIAISDFGVKSLLMANWARGLAAALTDAYYIVENPKGGLRSFWNAPDYHVWYCQYGSDRAKPTDLWGRLPDTFTPYRCQYGNRLCHHEPAPAGSDTGTQSNDLTPAERARVPYGLSKAILDAIERQPEPSPVEHEQAKLKVVE